MSILFGDKEYKSQLLDLISDNLPDMLWVKDLEGNYIFANRALCENLLMAHDINEPVGKNDIFFALREREAHRNNPAWHTFGELCFNSDVVVIENDKPMRFEEYGNIKGKLTYLEVFKAPFYGEDGEVLGTVGAGRDITEYKLLQQQLETSLETIDEIQEIAKIGTWKFNLCTGVLAWSDEMYRIYGVDKKEFTPSLETATSFVTFEDKAKIYRAITESIRLEKAVELQYTLHKRDGSLTHILVRGKVIRNKHTNESEAIGTSLDITQDYKFRSIIEEQREKYQYQATHDALTSLPNRVLFLDRLEHAILKASRDQYSVAILFLDIDNFKLINDSFGHLIGDEVLKELTRRMREASRRSDTIARLGGDEFCLILEDVNGIDAVIKRLESGMKIMEEPFVIEGEKIYLGLSIGVSLYPRDGITPQELVKNADTAMYKAKSEGKGRFCFYDSALTIEAIANVTMESKLRHAINDEAFDVYFQPQIDTLNEEIIGMEALVRWDHPELGVIEPGKFLPLAQSTGLMIAIDKIVMKKAITQFTQWYKEGYNPGILSMNLTVQQLQTEGFVTFIDQLIQTLGCSTKHIEFEVTESQIMKDPAAAIETLNALKSLDIKLSIDDFGTGYSSLAYLKRLPIHKLKIDKSFVDDLPEDMDAVAIVKAVISLADSLGLEIIAEGVEREEQKEFLSSIGCHYVQGFIYSKPLSAIEMSRYLQRNSVGVASVD